MSEGFLVHLSVTPSELQLPHNTKIRKTFKIDGINDIHKDIDLRWPWPFKEAYSISKKNHGKYDFFCFVVLEPDQMALVLIKVELNIAKM